MNKNANYKELGFASTEKMGCYDHLLLGFLVDIIGFEREALLFAFVSDESTIWDFIDYGQDPEADKAQIALWQAHRRKEWVDVSDLEPVSKRGLHQQWA
jgi:hypothetical protein